MSVKFTKLFVLSSLLIVLVMMGSTAAGAQVILDSTPDYLQKDEPEPIPEPFAQPANALTAQGATIFFEDFSGPFPGAWSVGTNAFCGWNWPFSPGGFDDYAFTCIAGGIPYYYPDNLFTYMMRHVNLADYSTATLSFDRIVQTEPGFDWFTVSIWDGSWHTVFSESGTSTATWTPTDIDLSAYAGLPDVFIEFKFTSNGSVSGFPYAGIYIDNVMLTADDAYEENDTLGTAYDLSFWQLTWLSTIAGYGVQADQDWYRIYVTPGYEHVQVEAIFSDAQGDIDICLTDGSGIPLDCSTSISDNESIDVVVPAGGAYYYIRVYYGNAGNLYDLWWDDIANPPGAFNKTAPPNGAINQPAEGLTLSWETSTWADSYDYCIDTINNNACDTSWTPNGTSTSVVLNGLSQGTTYYWQVRAYHAPWTTYSNGSAAAFWNFTTVSCDPPPGIVTLVAPANDITTPDNTPYLDWNPASNASEYQVQVDNNADFSSPIVDSITSDTFRTSPALSDGLYYWRVRGHNYIAPCNEWGTWSDIWHFVVDTTGPSIPVLVAPTNGILTKDTTPTFDWDASTGGPSYYQFQVDNDPGFGTPEINLNVFHPTTQYTPGVDLAYGTYYWRVRAFDMVDNPSAWSTVWSVNIVECHSPGVVSLITPADTGTVGDNTPFLDWNPASYANEYQIQLDNNSNFSSPIIDTTTASTFYTAPSLGDGTYYWRVRGLNTITPCNEWGPWSAEWSFIVDTMAPTAPTLVTPANGSTSTDTTPTFDWNASGGSPFLYQIQVDNDSNFSSPVIDELILDPTTEYTPLSVLAEDTYYWRVRARDDVHNWSNWSSVWSVIIDICPAPGTVTLVAPTNGTATADNTPYLDWGTAIYAYEYQIQVDDSAAFTSPVVDTTTSNSFYTSPVLGDGTYYWRVRGHNNNSPCNEWGTWSVVWSFTVDVTAPIAPTLITPANASTVTDDTPTFDWNASSGDPFEYLIQVDNDPAFGSPEIDQIIAHPTTDYTPISALPVGTYYWRVRAQDAVGNESGWSAIWSVTIEPIICDIPGVPVLVSPINGNIISDSTPLLDWNTATNSGEYQIQVDDSAAFSSPVVDTTTLNSDYTTPTLSAGIFYWRVRGHNDSSPCNEWGPWSIVWSFTIGVPPTFEELTNTSFEIFIPAKWRDGENIGPDEGPDCGAGNAHTGSCSLRFNGDGTSKRVFSLNPFSANAGDSFTLSMYRKGQSVPADGHTYANLILFYTDGTKETFVLWLHQGDLSVWQERSFTVIATKNVKRYNLNIFYKKASGTLWVDDISLTRNGGTQLVADPSFERYKPDDWMLSENITPDDGPTCTPAEVHSGDCSLRFVGDGTNKRLLMRVRKAGNAGDLLNISVYRKAQSMPSLGATYINVILVNTDGTQTHHILWLHQGDTSVWQQLTLEITAAKDYKWINVNIFYKKASGTIWLDDISLMAP